MQLPQRIYRQKEVCALLNIKSSYLAELINDGKLHAGIPITPGGRILGWFEAWIVDYQQSLIALSEAERASRPPARGLQAAGTSNLTSGRGRPRSAAPGPRQGPRQPSSFSKDSATEAE